MSLIKNIIKNILSLNKKNDLILYQSLSTLSHELKNNFIAIRAASGNINRSIKSLNEEKKINIIEKSVTGIDKKLNDSITLLNMITTITNPAFNWPEEISSFSIQSILQQSIQIYPFPSEKYASLINISTITSDFFVTGNSQLLMCVFYCLIKHGLNTLYNSKLAEIIINIENNKVIFKYVKNIIPDNSDNCLFSILTSKIYGNGFDFINKVLKSMNGSAEINNIENDSLVITLNFKS